MISSTRNHLIKKLLYRSKQMGWLEVDLILGSWATKNLNRMSDYELLNYEKLLNEDTVTIYKYLTKTEKINSNLDNNLVNKIIDDSKVKINSPKKYSLLKKYMSN